MNAWVGLRVNKGVQVNMVSLIRVGTVLALVLGLAGCTAQRYRRSADREAARIIAEKTPAVPNMDPQFTIEPPSATSVLDGLPVKSSVEPALGSEAEVERDARVLSLEQALALGVKHARDYQNQKEDLYLAALSLSLARYNFTPIFSSGTSVRAQNQPQDVARAIDQVAGTQTSLIERDTQVVQQYNVTGGADNGVRILLRSGARLVSSFSVDFLRFLNGDARWIVGSSLGATLTQPLLRGAGYKVTMENLTQAERSMLYSLRGFTQFRKDFAVRIAQRYYDVLRARDEVRNNYQGFQNYQKNVERQRALAAEGRIPRSELGQIEQGMLNAESAWVGAIRAYRQSLDEFKISLGQPVDARIMLDDLELQQLTIRHPHLSATNAVDVALATRLDLATSKDRRDDAERRVVLAANALKPSLDVVVSGTIDNRPGSLNPFELDPERARGSVGVNADLGLDRKRERNEYRAALIEKERAVRQYALEEDTIKLRVLDSWRALDQAKRTFEINELGVQLAERRLEEQELRAELGKTTGLALVDAQDALIRSRNNRTTALVSHTIARLQFWNSMGILYIKENGQWEEVADAKPANH